MKTKPLLVISTLALVAVSGIAMMVINRGDGDSSWRTKNSAGGIAPYDVELSPVGVVHFQKVPERVVTMDDNYNDMLVAIGQARKLVASGYRDNSYSGFYHSIDGLKVGYDTSKLTYLSTPGGGNFDKEMLYSLRADVHHIDPLQLSLMRGWSKADVDEIARNVAPFFANRYSRDNSYPGSEPYKYYNIWELAEKVGEVYQRPETIRQLRSIHEKMMESIRPKLPPESTRQRVGLVYYNNGRFTIYSLASEGFGQAQYRDLGVRDAFATLADRAYGGKGGPVGSPLDAEGLLAMNPDVLIMPFALNGGAAAAAFDQLLALKNDPVLQRVNAFRDGRIYPGGTPLQGPIFHIFQTEMAAKQIYPEIFGTFRNDHVYPDSEQLFDRGQLARVLMENNPTRDGGR